MAGKFEVRWMVCTPLPGIANSMVSAVESAFAAVMADRNEFGFDASSLVFVTVKVAA
jgi:hypothetical protein